MLRTYLTTCVECHMFTSKKYAKEHEGLCKACTEPTKRVPTRNERIIDVGYQAYAREEGYYDGPDY